MRSISECLRGARGLAENKALRSGGRNYQVPCTRRGLAQSGARHATAKERRGEIAYTAEGPDSRLTTFTIYRLRHLIVS
ncbi:hypothetical protein NDU88_007959 [Pleurodeles waltl]|uniref:Uncharacterized protein n=1 Tax=Pleurodeles waltl TaxID=8319 RepID=A0AAV7N556_PLEWA|nr:hypothetical protein NDU88_007959 [Pleurodeles waltl]